MKAKEIIYGIVAFLGLILSSCEPLGWINVLGLIMFLAVAGGAVINQERQKKEGGSHGDNR